MVGAARNGSLNALTEIIFDAIDDYRCVVDCIYLRSCQRERELIIDGISTCEMLSVDAQAIRTWRARPWRNYQLEISENGDRGENTLERS